jgi:hypothetical protein
VDVIMEITTMQELKPATLVMLDVSLVMELLLLTVWLATIMLSFNQTLLVLVMQDIMEMLIIVKLVQ